MIDVAGLSILITGGGSGLGEGAAEYFAKRGALVTVAGRRAAKVDAVATRLGANVVGVVGDVTVPQHREAMVAAAVQHGGGKLDALISNAGNMYRGPIDQLDATEVLALFDTNVVAGMMLSGLAKPHLEATKGCILFVGSVHTQRAFPGASPYAATKGALEALTGVLAAELGPVGIRVGCVRPGAVPTEINVRAGLGSDAEARERLAGLASAHALGEIGTPAHIAEAFHYLIGAQWTTGAVLTVDGGLGLGVTNA